jgi:hypothetical protein
VIRKILVLTTFAAFTSLVACKGSGDGATAGDGGKQPKLLCKMNNQCWVCPDEAAMKKCILNPVTSGCKQSASDCN